jgi:hypothetical protein
MLSVADTTGIAGISRAVLQQQMGYASDAMTDLYSGCIPLEQVKSAFKLPVVAGVIGTRTEEVA